MSFTSTVKDEISHVEPDCSHCDCAMLAALIRVEGNLLFAGPGRLSLEVVTDVPQAARFVVKVLHGRYHLQTEIVSRRSVLHKTPNWLIEVPHQPGLNKALVELGVIAEDGSLERGVASHLVAKQCCAKAYLRGAFMGSGFVSDPRGDFHFEMTYANEKMAEDVVALMARFEIAAKTMLRRSNHIVYLKSGNAIKDFLALTGAHTSALAMENARVIKSVRNDVNRRVNAEVANQAKTSAASLEQIRTIRKVLSHQDIRELPEALQDYIRLRVTHPDATLRELGDLCDPPLSKSAIYHRVRRLEELASKIR